MAVVERNYGNEFLIRMVIQKRNELKVDIKTSYSLSIKEVSWKYPSFTNVKKNDNDIQGSDSYV